MDAARSGNGTDLPSSGSSIISNGDEHAGFDNTGPAEKEVEDMETPIPLAISAQISWRPYREYLQQLRTKPEPAVSSQPSSGTPWPPQYHSRTQKPAVTNVKPSPIQKQCDRGRRDYEVPVEERVYYEFSKKDIGKNVSGVLHICAPPR